ncbi:hypothetical protein NHQ30_008415 [Ciborinia camelliae]|nr:hypothetical protein NHQ30_008415 [Ciborinia camelliae]
MDHFLAVIRLGNLSSPSFRDPAVQKESSEELYSSELVMNQKRCIQQRRRHDLNPRTPERATSQTRPRHHPAPRKTHPDALTEHETPRAAAVPHREESPSSRRGSQTASTDRRTECGASARNPANSSAVCGTECGAEGGSSMAPERGPGAEATG